MNWEAIGAIGEVFGALGVIATLGYLAVQIRQNTISTRTSSYQAVVTSAAEWTRAVGLDADAARIIAAGAVDYGSLSGEDRLRFDLLFQSLFRNYENIFFQHMQGAISDDTWAGWSSRMRSTFALPGFRVCWDATPEAYSGAFASFLETTPSPGARLPESTPTR
jgi:hypothetical protein